ncbi:MAG: OmpA family protein [Hellea sp.]|nr:OmpA family protein [Hellea sp.]
MQKILIGKFGLTLFLILGASQFTIAQTLPCSSHNQKFKVYFESDKAAPTKSGLAILDQAMTNIEYAGHCVISNVTISGHQDTKGSDYYNSTLSFAMAFAISDALIARGISEDIMMVDGKGESELDKNTPDEVREPLNRRVDVTITLAER